MHCISSFVYDAIVMMMTIIIICVRCNHHHNDDTIICVRCDHHDSNYHHLCTMQSSSGWQLSSSVYDAIIIMMAIIIICPKARRAQSRPEGPQPASGGPEGPKTSSIYIKTTTKTWLSWNQIKKTRISWQSCLCLGLLLLSLPGAAKF